MDFYGLPTEKLENKFLRLEYLKHAGPRIVRLSVAGSATNLLAEVPDSVAKTPFGEYHFRGGHRLWHAPEKLTRTYEPDDAGLEVKPLSGGVCLMQPVEARTGIRKSIEIQLLADRAGLILHHRLENTGEWAVELAPWAITQMALGGVGIIPQHTAVSPRSGLLPDRRLSLWPYTQLADPRLHLYDDFILVDGASSAQPCKIGVMNTAGWMGYLQAGVFFRKRFEPHPQAPHVDFGCNCEIYVGDAFLEIETLAPLQLLQPGETASHVETWELFSGVDYPLTLEGVRGLVRDILPGSS